MDWYWHPYILSEWCCDRVHSHPGEVIEVLLTLQRYLQQIWVIRWCYKCQNFQILPGTSQQGIPTTHTEVNDLDFISRSHVLVLVPTAKRKKKRHWWWNWYLTHCVLPQELSKLAWMVSVGITSWYSFLMHYCLCLCVCLWHLCLVLIGTTCRFILRVRDFHFPHGRAGWIRFHRPQSRHLGWMWDYLPVW